MAEVMAALGIVASVAQLADYGFKLSMKLFAYSEAVYSADKSIKSISSDVSLTSTVLRELCGIIKSDETRIVSNEAIEATRRTVEECLKLFEELESAIDRSMSGMGLCMTDGEKAKGKAKKRDVAFEKLKWPFKQPKMELLRSNLDRLKANLALMLQVLSYARDVSNRQTAQSSLAYQKHIIESLARSEKVMKQKYYALQNAIEAQQTPQAPVLNATDNTAVHVTRSRGLENESPTDGAFSIATRREKQDLPPNIKPQTLIAELLLCFQLLNDLLGYQMLVMQGEVENRLTSQHDEILNAVRIGVRLYDNAPPHEKAEAAQNVQLRVREIIRNRYLKPRMIEAPSRKEEKTSADTMQYSLDMLPSAAMARSYEESGNTGQNEEHVGPMKGILRKPQEKFPEHPIPIREGVSPSMLRKIAKPPSPPPYRRWTTISRKLVSPEVLEIGSERYKISGDELIVLRVLQPDEIQTFVNATKKIRRKRAWEAKYGKRSIRKMSTRVPAVDEMEGENSYDDESDDTEAAAGLELMRIAEGRTEAPSDDLSLPIIPHYIDSGESSSYIELEDGSKLKATTVVHRFPKSMTTAPTFSRASAWHKNLQSNYGDDPTKQEIMASEPMARMPAEKFTASISGFAETASSRIDYLMIGGPPDAGIEHITRSKYQFKFNSDDELDDVELENEAINLDELSHASSRLNLLAKATDEKSEEQNMHNHRITPKSDRVDDQIAPNRLRLDRIDGRGQDLQESTKEAIATSHKLESRELAKLLTVEHTTYQQEMMQAVEPPLEEDGVWAPSASDLAQSVSPSTSSQPNRTAVACLDESRDEREKTTRRDERHERSERRVPRRRRSRSSSLHSPSPSDSENGGPGSYNSGRPHVVYERIADDGNIITHHRYIDYGCYYHKAEEATYDSPSFKATDVEYTFSRLDEGEKPALSKETSGAGSFVDSDEEEEDVVAGLLAQWTNLPI